jgi:thioredoxin-like negative regulator of GroEL
MAQKKQKNKSRDAERRGPNFEELLHHGEEAMEEEDFEEAEAAFLAALELAPDSPEAHVRLGALLLETDDFEIGVKHLK